MSVKVTRSFTSQVHPSASPAADGGRVFFPCGRSFLEGSLLSRAVMFNRRVSGRWVLLTCQTGAAGALMSPKS